MKILFMIRDPFVDAYPKLIEDAKALADEVKVLYTDNGISIESLIKEVKDVDIIVVAIVKIDREVIDAASKLKYIIKFGAGYDNIDVEYAYEKGIPVTNAPGYNAEAVADHAFGLMLSAARDIPRKNKEMKSNHWELSVGHEIYKKRLGIVGFGSIGKAIAKRAAGFNMKTIAFGNYKDYEAAKKWNVTFVSKEELFQASDYIIISTSLTDQNRQMVNKELLNRMKPTAFIINISRGALINEEDLIDALKQHKIKGAALDVFETEPPNNELAILPNVVATSHIGGSTYESIQRIGNLTIQNISRLLENEPLEFVVTPALIK
ncbi:NAD(P)-dependent oxidoreductase [Niallia endozanthoxylica]|uniref:Phosphoglycerate dehydrogenase n=1 Tax=Niallia endozanthoxylica TaxID=2036016 RepID=A0A5J5HP71_9BACI|nr:phosphoglycerate dehydrogenase [Niallia endozanthoxylica]KAA9023603.1 phosphoglycerate dehydrogenase [Niallia endozanthoxylica]